MVPINKVQDIIIRYDALEKDLSSGSVDPKVFAKKSKEYANLGNIILVARKFVNFENEKQDLENIGPRAKNPSKSRGNFRFFPDIFNFPGDFEFF